jgi:RecB family exonuclease
MSAPPKKKLYSAPFHRLEPLLSQVLAGLAGGDPLSLRRVVIAGPLRDRLQALLARSGAVAGVSFYSLRQLAEEIAGERMRPRRPLPPLGGPAAAQAALRGLAGDLGPLRPPAEGRDYAEAAFATWTDLAEGGFSSPELKKLAGKFSGEGRARIADLARIMDGMEARFGNYEYFEITHLLERASEEAEREPPRIPTIIYGFSDMNALQRRFVDALCQVAEAAAFVPADPEAPACRFALPMIRWFEARGFEPAGVPVAPPGAERLLETPERPLEAVARRLFSPGKTPEPPPEIPAGALRVIAAPSESREAFELCRELLWGGEADEREAGVLMTARERQEGLLREVFGGLTGESEGAIRLAGSRAGRAFLSMLGLREAGYPRENIFRFLDEGQFAESKIFRDEILGGAGAGGAGASETDGALVSGWEYRTRRLPYVSGAAEWRWALISPAFRRDFEKHYPEDAALFKRTTLRLLDILESLPARALPSGHAAASVEAFGSLTAFPELPEKEIAGPIENLGELDGLLGEIELGEFGRWARMALEKTRGNGGAARVRLMPLQQARGLSFETVAIPGMAEGVFPARGAEDPLLPDALRERLNELSAVPGEPDRLPLKAARPLEDRFLFWTALLSAEKRVILGYPRSGGGRAEESDRPPGLYLSYLAEALGLEGEGAESSLPGYREAAVAVEPETIQERPVIILEHELSRLLAQIGDGGERGSLGDFVSEKVGFGRRLAAWEERWREDTLTPFDGAFTDPGLIGNIREFMESGPAAVTSLENFFACPYRYALRYWLGLRERKEGGLEFEAGADVRGTLYHDTLKGFADGAQKEGKGFGELSAARRTDLIQKSTGAAFRAYENENPVPPPVSWRLLREEIERDLNEFFGEAYSGGPGWRVAEVEGSFGGENDPQSVEAEGGRNIPLIGRFDLAERRAGGEGEEEDEIRFIDYKSGRSSGISVKKPPGLGGGERLQADLYAQCAAGRFGTPARISAAYAFPSERGGYKFAHIPAEIIEERRDEVKTLLGFYAEAMESGRFFPAPSEGTCRFCEFVPVCGPDRTTRAARKTGHDFWKKLTELREMTK